MLESNLPRGRARLSAVIRAAGDIVRIDDAARTLEVPRVKAAKQLSRWAGQGWLRRVGAGAYAPAPVELLNSEQVVHDTWVLVPALFAPAYIAGRTAAEHWDLTEQIFRDTVVFTARPVKQKTVTRQGAVFTLKHIRQERIFGVKTVWRGRTRVQVSDPHRTIIDMLNSPAAGGGIQHIADCFDRYMKRADFDPEKLISYAERLGNGAVFKRLGFLAEQRPQGRALAEKARAHLTSGNVKLDPALKCSRLVTRWRLWAPPDRLPGRLKDAAR